MSDRRLAVRGGASAEEVAALLVVLAQQDVPPPVDPLQHWRRLRQAVTKPT